VDAASSRSETDSRRTLWRSAPVERISTVRYRTVDEERLQSDVDFEVTAFTVKYRNPTNGGS
jgi:hypothetical protein